MQQHFLLDPIPLLASTIFFKTTNKCLSMNQGGASGTPNVEVVHMDIGRVLKCPKRAITELMKEVNYMFLAMGLKYFDYTMSGILLFIVTWRAKFVAKGDESLWWHICRIFNSTLLSIFCFLGVPLMSMALL